MMNWLVGFGVLLWFAIGYVAFLIGRQWVYAHVGKVAVRQPYDLADMLMMCYSSCGGPLSLIAILIMRALEPAP